jgi:hypothetical protein
MVGPQLHTAFLAVRAAEIAHAQQQQQQQQQQRQQQQQAAPTPGDRQWMLCW